MDAGIFILVKFIPKEIGLYYNQRILSFGGQKYPQDEISYNYNSNKIFEKSKLSEWIYTYLPKQFAEEYICLNLDHQILHEIEMYQNNKSDNKSYVFLIEKLLQSNISWAFIFLEHWDSIEESIECDRESTMKKFLYNLDWSNERIGFVCYSLKVE